MTKRTKKRLSEHFNDEIDETGIPSLRDYLNQMSEEYLAENYYQDLERRLDKEADHLVRFFRQRGKTIEAELSGAGEQITALVDSVESEIIPWINQQVGKQIQEFRRDAIGASDAIRNRMDHAVRMSEIRLGDKRTIWSLIQWNSLKATARKGGSHTTCSGRHIDINNDLCSLLVDDLILAWSSYRDYLVSERLDHVTSQIASELERRLAYMADEVNMPAAKAAVRSIVEQIGAMAQAQRERMIARLNEKIRSLESIRQPAYDYIQETMSSTYAQIANECGVGCSRRMQGHIDRGLEANWERMIQHIRSMVANAVGDLMDVCCDTLQDFSSSTSARRPNWLATSSNLITAR